MGTTIMPSSLFGLRQRNEAKKVIRKVFENSDSAIVIHYACESFFRYEDGASPRISCISAKNLGSGTITSFSIHHIAERNKIYVEQLHENYEYLERILLDDFFEYVSMNQGYTWIHWNMRSVNFGFQALEHRYRVLGGNPIVLPDTRKIDLSNLFVKIYGPRYCEKPVLANLCAINDIKSDFFMEGSKEAAAFEAGEFAKIHQSNMKKVDFISYVAELSLENKLKVGANWWKSHGLHPAIALEFITEHWIYGIIVLLVTLVTAIQFLV